MGRNKFSQREINIISKLLRKKNEGNRFEQKQIRHKLRVNFEFSISDFGEPGKAFGPEELDAAIRRGAIRILDDATIASMKEKRERDRKRDAMAVAAEATASGQQTDWHKAMKQWEEWENSVGSDNSATE